MTSIDPRFDPRFQRGYADEGDAPSADAGSPAGAGSSAGLGVRSSSDAGASSSAGVPAAIRIPDPPASVVPTVPTAETPRLRREPTVDRGVSAQTWALGEEGDDDEHDDNSSGSGDQRPAGHNPWLVVLWAVSIALIVVPTTVVRQALGEQRNAQWSDLGPPPEVIFMQLALQLAPALVLMGGIGLLLVIGMHAWGWNNRHRTVTS